MCHGRYVQTNFSTTSQFVTRTKTIPADIDVATRSWIKMLTKVSKQTIQVFGKPDLGLIFSICLLEVTMQSLSVVPIEAASPSLNQANLFLSLSPNITPYSSQS